MALDRKYHGLQQMEASSFKIFTTWIAALVLLTCCDRGFGSNVMTVHECYERISDPLVIECNSTLVINVLSAMVGTSFGWTPGQSCPNNDASCTINIKEPFELCDSKVRCQINKTIINKRIQTPCQATNFITIEYTCVSEQKSTFEEVERSTVGLDLGIIVTKKWATVTPAAIAGYCCLGLSIVIATGVVIMIVRRKLRNRNPDNMRTTEDGFRNGKMEEESLRDESLPVASNLEKVGVQPPSDRASSQNVYSLCRERSAVGYDNPAYWKLGSEVETIMAEVKTDGHNYDEISAVSNSGADSSDVNNKHVYSKLEESNQIDGEDGKANHTSVTYESICGSQIVMDSEDQSTSDKPEDGGSEDNKSDATVLNMPLPTLPEN